MKKLLLICLAAFIVQSTALAQSCTDTLMYAQSKATNFLAVTCNVPSEFSGYTQYHDAPQEVVVKGFRVYMGVNSIDPLDTAVVTGYLFEAGADSSVGSVLRQKHFTVGTTYVPADINQMAYDVLFDVPDTVSSAFHVGVKTSTILPLAIMTDDYNVNDGGSEDLGYWHWTGDSTWYPSGEFFVWNVDFLILPIVEYIIPSTVSVGGACIGNSVCTALNTPSIIQHRMYNEAVANGSPFMNSTTLDWGDGTVTGYPDNCHIYTSSGMMAFNATYTTGWDATCSVNASAVIPIAAATQSLDEVETCNPYYWSVSDSTYTVSTIDSVIGTNMAGCDSLMILDLTIVTNGLALPYVEDFEGGGMPSELTIQNVDGDSTWTYTNSASGFGSGSGSVVMDNFSTNNAGTQDVLVLPALDLSGETNVNFLFDVAYARFNLDFHDSLAVVVSTDCFATFTPVYYKGGLMLATAPDQAGAFTPTAGQWRTETIDLTPFLGNPLVQIAVINLSGWGQNLYLDNFNVSSCETPVADWGSVVTGPIVTFTDSTENEPTSWHWDFGDGTFSNQQNPGHPYFSSGTYTVCLIASNACGSDTTCSTVDVCIAEAPAITGFSNLSHHGTTVNWSSATLPAGGKFVVRYHEFGDSPNFSYKVVPNGSASSAYVNGLSENTRYVFRVGAKCAGQIMATFSDTMSVWTRNNCPQPIGMDDTISVDNVALYWNDMGADSYKLKYRPIGGIWDYRNTTSTFVNLSELDLGTSYEWKVRALCDDGGNRPYGPMQNFSTPVVRLASTDPQVSNEMAVYPNPTSGSFAIELGKELEQVGVVVRNSLGKIVASETYTNRSRVDDQLIGSPGIYLIEVLVNGAETVRFRLIKQ